MRLPTTISSWLLFGLLATSVVLPALIKNAPIPERLLSLARATPTVLPARIEPFYTMTVTSPIAGKVVSVLVSRGTEVTAGQALAVLESDELSSELQLAQRRLSYQVERLAAARAAEVRKTAVQIRREETQRAAEARDAARRRLESFSVAESEQAYADAEANLRELRSLLEQHLATAAEFQDAQSREQAELRNLRAAREHLSRLKEEAAASERQVLILRMQPLPAPGIDVKAAEMEYEEARSALAAARQKKDLQHVLAARAGTVLDLGVQAGEAVVQGAPLFKIADLSFLNFDVPVSPRLAQLLKPGNPVVARVPLEPAKRVDATVASIVFSPDPGSQSYLVRVTIPNPSPRMILAGLEGAVEFPHLPR